MMPSMVLAYPLSRKNNWQTFLHLLCGVMCFGVASNKYILYVWCIYYAFLQVNYIYIYINWHKYLADANNWPYKNNLISLPCPHKNLGMRLHTI